MRLKHLAVILWLLIASPALAFTGTLQVGVGAGGGAAAGGFATPALVGTYTESTDGGDVARTVGAGNLLVVIATWEDSVNFPTACTVGGTPATAGPGRQNNGNDGIQLYYFPNTSAGSRTISVTFGVGAVVPGWVALEFSGIATSTPLDVSASYTTLEGDGNTPGSNARTNNSTETAQTYELLVGVIKNYAGANVTPSSTPSAWSEPYDHGMAPVYGTDIQYLVVTSTGTYNCTGTLETVTHWAAVLATFKGASL